MRENDSRQTLKSLPESLGGDKGGGAGVRGLRVGGGEFAGLHLGISSPLWDVE